MRLRWWFKVGDRVQTTNGENFGIIRSIHRTSIYWPVAKVAFDDEPDRPLIIGLKLLAFERRKP